jgi:hypothetical protein
MPHFTQRIRTEFGKPEFFFNRIFTARGVKYHVSVLDESHTLRYFNLEVKGGKWYIIDSALVPAWIIALESELSETIKSHKPIDT